MSHLSIGTLSQAICSSSQLPLAYFYMTYDLFLQPENFDHADNIIVITWILASINIMVKHIERKQQHKPDMNSIIIAMGGQKTYSSHLVINKKIIGLYGLLSGLLQRLIYLFRHLRPLMHLTS